MMKKKSNRQAQLPMYFFFTFFRANRRAQTSRATAFTGMQSLTRSRDDNVTVSGRKSSYVPYFLNEVVHRDHQRSQNQETIPFSFKPEYFGETNYHFTMRPVISLSLPSSAGWPNAPQSRSTGSSTYRNGVSKQKQRIENSTETIIGTLLSKHREREGGRQEGEVRKYMEESLSPIFHMV